MLQRVEKRAPPVGERALLGLTFEA